jgi:DNA polymerase III alpha subunit
LAVDPQLVVVAVDVGASEPFERYRLNKAHATCYGLIAYQTAYPKANCTADIMAVW